MDSISIGLSFLLSLMGIGVAAFALNFLKNIRDNSERAMASFQLHPDETISEFKMLYYGLIIEFAAFVIYGIGGLLELSLLLNVARILSVGFIMIAIKISTNWWRRFK